MNDPQENAFALDLQPQTKRGMPVLVFTALFLGCLLGPWAWFNTDLGRSSAQLPSSNSQPGLWLTVRTNVPGYAFKPRSSGSGPQELLGTSEFLDGTFMNETGAEFHVFAANWRENRRGLAVLEHTPDICWIGAGWKPVDLKQPKRISVKLVEDEFPFECRVFRSPEGDTTQFVIWFTSVGGQYLAEEDRFPSNLDEDMRNSSEVNARQLALGRRLSASHFWQAITRRLPTNGSKQFVRLSTPCTDEWQSALRELQRFASVWIAEVPARHRSAPSRLNSLGAL